MSKKATRDSVLSFNEQTGSGNDGAALHITYPPGMQVGMLGATNLAYWVSSGAEMLLTANVK